MTEEVKAHDPVDTRLPIVLSLPEIQGILSALRKFPMEQVEALVMNIQNQANLLLAQMKQTEANETGETK
jgi:hypothetical protein